MTAPKKMKGGRELQLASMSLFTSKASSQHFFLRILKVIIQLRDAARSATKPGGKKKPGKCPRVSLIYLCIFKSNVPFSLFQGINLSLSVSQNANW